MKESDDGVSSDQESRDAKSRHVLRQLQNGQIRYRRRGGVLFCPFCGSNIHNDIVSMIRHATDVGRGAESRGAAVMAKHAAYGVFLKKLLARDIRLGLAQPPLNPNHQDRNPWRWQ